MHYKKRSKNWVPYHPADKKLPSLTLKLISLNGNIQDCQDSPNSSQDYSWTTKTKNPKCDTNNLKQKVFIRT